MEKIVKINNMSKATNLFIDTMIGNTKAKMSKTEILADVSTDKHAMESMDVITKAMREYALVFAQHMMLQVSHVEVTIADVEQFDKEI